MIKMNFRKESHKILTVIKKDPKIIKTHKEVIFYRMKGLLTI